MDFCVLYGRIFALNYVCQRDMNNFFRVGGQCIRSTCLIGMITVNMIAHLCHLHLVAFSVSFLSQTSVIFTTNWVDNTSELRRSTTVAYRRHGQALSTARFCHVGQITTADTYFYSCRFSLDCRPILKDDCRTVFVWFSKYFEWWFLEFLFLNNWRPVFCGNVFLLLDCRLFVFTLYCFVHECLGIGWEWE